MSLPLKVSSLQSKEIHVQNKLVFSNPYTVLSGSNTTLLFARLDTLEDQVSDLQSGGGGGSAAQEVYYPSFTAQTYEDLQSQLLNNATFSPSTVYNTFGRFAYSLGSPLLGTPFEIPLANSDTHFRISNETDLTVLPITTSLVLKYTDTNNSGVTMTNYYSMSSEIISARNSLGSWSFYNSA